MEEGAVLERSRPPEVEVRSLSLRVGEFESNCQRFAGVWDSRSIKQEVALVRGAYKRKDKKVNPVDVALSDGVNPQGGSFVQEEAEHAGKVVARGSRLTTERLASIRIGGSFLTTEERGLFVDILFEFEGAIAFDDSEMGCLGVHVEPPILAQTVPHIPWQQQNLRLPRSAQEEATKIVKQNLASGVLEFSQGPYRSRYFVVPKTSPGAFRLINDVQPMNRVTIRDAGMPPSVDEFSETFAGYPIASTIDFYASYNQILLDRRSRDLTAFMSELGLVRSTRLPQGWTNSVACFQRIICKVLWRHIPHCARPFVDDVPFRGPKDRYDDQEVRPGVRRFVAEHAERFRAIMKDIWESGLTISGKKLVLGMPGIVIVGLVCDAEGRHPEPTKVQRIIDWPAPRTLREARGFIGICVYYRIFVEGFSTIAAPILTLFRKSVQFCWTKECQQAMNKLKEALTTPPTLITLEFSPSAGIIVVTVDASKIGWGGILQQEREDGRLRPSRYESGIWSDAERKYDALKLECRGLLKALKKFRFWVHGRFFRVETDANTLVWLLNQPPNDLPNSMLTRWLTYIRLFDFEVRHVKGSKNSGADALSRRGPAPEDSDEDDDLDMFFEARLYATSATEGDAPHGERHRIWFDKSKYDDDDVRIGEYLTTMDRPIGLTDQQFSVFRKKALTFLVRDGALFKRGKRAGQPPRRVVGKLAERNEVLRGLHDEAGHRSILGTFHHVARRYQWRRMYEDCRRFVESCDECQRRARIRFEEPLNPTWSATVWDKVGLDVVHMPSSGGYKYIVFARDDLSGWLEGRALTSASSKSVAKFLQEDVFARHGCPRKVVVDGGGENKGFVEDLLEACLVKRVEISAYHPQSNGLVERGHDAMINSLSKYCQGQQGKWYQYLPLALWADRVSIRRSTGYSAFRLLYGRDCVLPVEFAVSSWAMVNWGEIRTTEDLLMARMKQLDLRNLEEARAAEALKRSRLGNKAYFDSRKRMRALHQQIREGDLVLMHNTRIQKSWDKKLDNNWLGPYRVREVSGVGFYRLMELDGSVLRESVAGNRLKKFFSRYALKETVDEDVAGSGVSADLTDPIDPGEFLADSV